MYRVLDLTRLYPGGLATRLLVDLGFEVIKVEDPWVGDYLRETSPMLFEWLNFGKRSVAIDLRRDRGRSIFYELVKRSHVVIESFRPGVAERLGVDYETLRKVNEGIVYCSISGYGSWGPYSMFPNHDINCAGVAGLLDPTLFVDREPRPITVQVADVGSALLCVIGVLTMLLRGVGGRVEVSMTEAALLFNLLNMANVHELGDALLTGKYPFYNVYRCRDGYITVGAIEERFWKNLCRALGRDDLVNRQFDKGTIEELSKEFGKYALEDALKLLWSHDVPAAPLNTIKDLHKDPQLASRGFTKGTFLNPLVINGQRPTASGKAPRRGEDTIEVLRWLGLGDVEIEELVREGVVGIG